MKLTDQFGEIDVYLFDQLLRGRIKPGMRVLDAGCGGGRNLIYLLQQGFDVFATDADPAAVRHVQRLGASLAPAQAASPTAAKNLFMVVNSTACAPPTSSSTAGPVRPLS